MSQTGETRIDKYLWAVRLFKTRSSATDACRNGRITVAGQPVKPSRTVNRGDTIVIKRMPVIYSYRVLAITENRLAAKYVAGYLEDITPEDEKNKLLTARASASVGMRDRGAGRPTKRERRDIDNLFDDMKVR